MELSRHEIENIICMKLNIEGLEKRIEDANKEIEKLKDKISNTRTGGNKDDNKFIQNCLKHNICYRCGKEMEFNGSEFCCPICGSIRLVDQDTLQSDARYFKVLPTKIIVGMNYKILFL